MKPLRYIWFLVRYWYNVWFDTLRLPPLKCPACGELQTARNRKISFESQYSQLIVTCWNCKARHGRDPVLPYPTWRVQGIDEYMAEQQAKEAEQYKQTQQDEIQKKGIRR